MLTYRRVMAAKAPDDITELDTLLDESSGSSSSWAALEQRLQQAVQRQALQSVRLVKFPTGVQLILAYRQGEPFIIDSPDAPFFKPAVQFLYDIPDRMLQQYYEEADPDGVTLHFWRGVGTNFTVYHGTDRAHLENILHFGLKRSNKTRGITNAGIGPAVFTSLEPTSTTVYGAVCVAVDVGLMKADGFMPEIGYEWPVWYDYFREAMAHRLGIEYFGSGQVSDGLSLDTIIFFADLPAKYVRLHKEP